MRTNLLIVKQSYNEHFQEFFRENDITEVWHLSAKSVRKNFLLDLFDLSEEELAMFIILLKPKKIAKLEEYCKNGLIDKHSGVLIKFKSEKEVMIEEEKKLDEKSANIKGEKTAKKIDNDKLVVSIVTAGFSELVIDALKSLDVSGATILNGKGVGANYSSFMGMGIDSERDIILIATNAQKAKKLQNAISKNIVKNEKAKGITFCVPLVDYIKFDAKK